MKALILGVAAVAISASAYGQVGGNPLNGGGGGGTAGTINTGATNQGTRYTGNGTTIGPSSCQTDTGSAYGVSCPETVTNTLQSQGDTTANPSVFNQVTSTNSGLTSGITATQVCSITQTFVTATSNYTAFASCSDTSGGFTMYRSLAHTLNAPSWNAIFTCSNAGNCSTSVGSITAPGGVFGPRFTPSGTSPTIAAGAAAGTSPTVTATGNNQSHVLNITTGTSPATGTLATVTFNGTLSSAPNGCFLTPRNSATPPAMTSVYTTAPTTTTYTISVLSALTASTAYSWSALCM